MLFLKKKQKWSVEKKKKEWQGKLVSLSPPVYTKPQQKKKEKKAKAENESHVRSEKAVFTSIFRYPFENKNEKKKNEKKKFKQSTHTRSHKMKTSICIKKM